MKLFGYNELPDSIAAQIGAVAEVWKKRLSGDLAGIYLHGSIALGAFCPDSGDIDLLIVTRRGLSADERLAIAKEIIALDNHPRPLEMSAVRVDDLGKPGDVVCVFHYSGYWTGRYLARFNDPGAECYVVDNDFHDADIKSYIKLIKQCEIVLYGEPTDIFPDVSDEEFWAAISADVDDYDFHAYEPRYLASNILILGRILSFKYTRRILSKYDGGVWMISHLPKDLKYLAKRAMRVWFDGAEADFPEDELERLRNFLINEITE